MQKYGKKYPIHENADANLTCDFCDGDISIGVGFPHMATTLARL